MRRVCLYYFVLLPLGLRPFQYLVWIATITLSCIVLGRWQVYLMIAIFTAAVIVMMQPLSFGWEDILIISMTGVLLNETHFRLGTVVARKVQRTRGDQPHVAHDQLLH